MPVSSARRVRPRRCSPSSATRRPSAPGAAEPFLHPGASGELRVGSETVAALGELHPETAAAFGLDVPAALLVLDLAALERAPRAAPRYRELSRQPKVRRDLALLLDEHVAAGDVLEAIRKTAGSALQSGRRLRPLRGARRARPGR